MQKERLQLDTKDIKIIYSQYPNECKVRINNNGYKKMLQLAEKAGLNNAFDKNAEPNHANSKIKAILNQLGFAINRYNCTIVYNQDDIFNGYDFYLPIGSQRGLFYKTLTDGLFFVDVNKPSVIKSESSIISPSNTSSILNSQEDKGIKSVAPFQDPLSQAQNLSNSSLSSAQKEIIKDHWYEIQQHIINEEYNDFDDLGSKNIDNNDSGIISYICNKADGLALDDNFPQASYKCLAKYLRSHLIIQEKFDNNGQLLTDEKNNLTDKQKESLKWYEEAYAKNPPAPQPEDFLGLGNFNASNSNECNDETGILSFFDDHFIDNLKGNNDHTFDGSEGECSNSNEASSPSQPNNLDGDILQENNRNCLFSYSQKPDGSEDILFDLTNNLSSYDY